MKFKLDMLQELLFKDLSSRLPYGIKCQFEDTIEIIKEIWFCEDEGWQVDGEKTSTCIHAVKPYLFPMSSMTEEQKEEFDRLYTFDALIIGPQWELIDWLNENHFDYRGLIEKGLALDATNKNIY
jgi:hypothetical protein